MALFGLGDAIIFYIPMRVAIIIVKMRTIVNPVMRDTVAVASGKIYKRGKGG